MLDDAKWNSSTDIDKCTPPIVDTSGTASSPPRKGLVVVLTNADGVLLATISRKTAMDCYWENTDQLIRMDLEFEGQGLEPHFMLEAERLAWTYREAKNYHGVIPHKEPYTGGAASPVGLREQTVHKAMSFWGPQPGFNTDSYLYIFVPYTWHDKDLAELFNVITRYYTDGGPAAQDFLNKESLIKYSERMQDPLYRVRMTYWAVMDERLTDTIRSLASQTGALIAFGSHDSATLDFKLRMMHWLDLDDNTEPIEVRQINDREAQHGRDSWLMSSVQINTDPRIFTNYSRVEYGIFIWMAFDDVRYINKESASLKDEANIIQDEDKASVDLYGRHGENSTIRAPNVHIPLDASTIFDGSRWRVPPRKLVFTQGPLHFDYLAGDKIHMLDEHRGVYTEDNFVVTEKLYDWDVMGATVEAHELSGGYRPAPPDELRSIESVETVMQNDPLVDLLAWWSADDVNYSGVTLDVLSWPDKSGNGKTANQNLGVIATPKIVLLDAAINAHNWVDFNHLNPVGTGLLIANIIEPDNYASQRGLFIQAVIKIDAAGAAIQSVFSGGETGTFASSISVGGVATTWFGAEVTPVNTDIVPSGPSTHLTVAQGTPGTWHLLEIFISQDLSRDISLKVYGWLDGAFQDISVNPVDITNSLVTLQTNSYMGTDWTIPTTNNFFGGLADLVIWRNIPHAASIHRARSYFRDRYGLTLIGT